MSTAGSGAAIADAVLEEVSRGTNAAGAILWRLSPEGTLELVGQAGLTSGEASRWQHVPGPMINTLCQQVARRREPIWLRSAGEAADGVALTGGWLGGRAVLPLLGPTTVLGVLEVCWPAPIKDFPASLRKHLSTLADVCARTLDLRSGDPTLHTDPDGWPYAVLDGVLDSGLFVRPAYTDTDGTAITDFEVSHVTERFADPAGRPSTQLVGRRLTALYPGLVTQPLFDHLQTVLRTGVPYQLDHLPMTALAPGSGSPRVVNLRVARFVDGLLVSWRPHDTTDRLADVLANVQRLGRIGGWEYTPVDGRTTWTDYTYALFDLAPGTAAPSPEELRTQVHPDDVPYLSAFLDLLLQQKQSASTNLRFLRDDGTLRQIRASAEPVLTATGELTLVRGTFQDISQHYHTQIALSATQDQLATTEDQVQEQLRIALQLQRAILPPADRPLRLGRSGGSHALPAAGGRAQRRRRLVRRGRAPRRPPGAVRRWRCLRPRHHRVHDHGRAAQRPARPGHHRRRPGSAAGVAEHDVDRPLRGHHRDHRLRLVRAGHPYAALGQGRTPAADARTGWHRHPAPPTSRDPARRQRRRRLRGVHAGPGGRRHAGPLHGRPHRTAWGRPGRVTGRPRSYGQQARAQRRGPRRHPDDRSDRGHHRRHLHPRPPGTPPRVANCPFS
nr:PAS domain-containing protein [Fodinicola feengrottensis]